MCPALGPESDPASTYLAGSPSPPTLSLPPHDLCQGHSQSLLADGPHAALASAHERRNGPLNRALSPYVTRNAPLPFPPHAVGASLPPSAFHGTTVPSSSEPPLWIPLVGERASSILRWPCNQSVLVFRDHGLVSSRTWKASPFPAPPGCRRGRPHVPAPPGNATFLSVFTAALNPGLLKLSLSLVFMKADKDRWKRSG